MKAVHENSSAEYHVPFWINSTLKFVKVAETWYNSIQLTDGRISLIRRETQ
jgi:hypothetical protein